MKSMKIKDLIQVLIDCISTSYANMDKYGILDTAEMFSASYEIKKKIN